MFVIKPNKNLTAKLIGDVPDGLNKELEQSFVWTDPLDFANTVCIYQDRQVRVGAMQGLAEYLNEKGFPTRIELPNLGPKPFEWEFLGQLRQLQPRLPSAAFEHRFGLLAAMAGVGKTIMLSNIIATLGRPAVVFTEAEEPFYGAIDALKQFTTCNVGILGCGISEPNDVTVCMVQTMNRRITIDGSENDFINVLRNAQVWITDEAHNCLCASYGNLYDQARNVHYFLGTTATPFASNEKETLLYAQMGPIIAEIKYGEAIENNLLVPFTLYTEPCPPQDKYKGDSRKYRYDNVYKSYITANKVRCDKYIEFARECIKSGMTVAIIVSRTKHGNFLKKLMPELTEVYGTTSKKDRTQAWKDLNSRKIKCVVTTLMDEATNIPSLDAVGMAAGGKSKTKLIQRLRNLRVFDGETEDGWYTKERGFVYMTIDDAPYLKTHSKLNLDYFKELAREHPSNQIIKL